MRRSLTTLATLALLLWSRIASAQAPESSCPGTRAEVEVLAVSDMGPCGTLIIETVARVRVVRSIAGPPRHGDFLALILCVPEQLQVGTVYEACIGVVSAIPVDARLDRFRDDPSPRIRTDIVPRSGRPPTQNREASPSDRAIAPRRR